MSSGWTIEEHLDQEKGCHNKYYYGDKPAPAIQMSDKISQQYAAYTLIDKDLRSTIAWLEEIERLAPQELDRVKAPEKMDLIKGLFVASLTFYGKCFTKCDGRKVKLEATHIPEQHQKTHEKVMALRHNFAAHSGNEKFEDVTVSLVLHPEKSSNMKPQLYTELSQPDYICSSHLPFKALARDLQKAVREKRDKVGETALEKVVRPKGKDYWYSVAKS